ncbi:four helix bundle protein [Runella sp.]|uniref:four helix bundle protein n=1 Tax=Runella sp. TaxID=1960881 RepID=UPI003D0D94BD
MDEIRSFRDLKCWKEGVNLRKMAKPLLDRFPADEKYRLTNQLIRALRSVTNNIAEGFGRYHYQENIQFCRISRGSLTEIQDHFLIALEENYITNDEYQSIDTQTEKCLALINGYINYLRKRKSIDTDNS